MGEKQRALFNRDFITTLSGQAQRGVNLTIATRQRLAEEYRNLPMQVAGGAGMVISAYRLGHGYLRLRKMDRSVRRMLDDMYIHIAKCVRYFDDTTGNLEQALDEYHKLQETYRKTHFDSSKDMRKFQKQLEVAKQRVIRETRMIDFQHKSWRVTLTHINWDHLKAFERVLQNDGSIRTMSYLTYGNEGVVMEGFFKSYSCYEDPFYEDPFPEIMKRAEILEKNPRLAAGLHKKIFPGMGKGIVTFAGAYALYLLGEPNDARLDAETLDVLEEFYKSICTTVEQVPDKFDYLYGHPQCEELVNWALENTQDASEKEMLELLKTKYDYDFYAYLKGEYNIELQAATDELSTVVTEEMEFRIRSNTNGAFYTQLEKLREEKASEKENEFSIEERSVSQTLAGVSNHEPIQTEAAIGKTWHAEMVSDEDLYEQDIKLDKFVLR